jgi:hypothetical protein
VSAPSPATSAASNRRASPTRLRPTPPVDPQRNRVDPAPSLGIGIISDLEPEPELAAGAPRAPRFMRPRPMQGGAAANAAHARPQFDFDPQYALGAGDGELGGFGDLGGSYDDELGGGDGDGGYCRRCELLDGKLEMMQSEPTEQRAAQLEVQLQSLQLAKDDQEQVLRARVAALEILAVSGSRKQEIGVLEDQIQQNKEQAEAKEKQLVDAAKADKTKALRQQKFKMARYLEELSDTKTMVEDLNKEIAALKSQSAVAKKKKNEGAAAAAKRDEDAVQLAMKLADAEDAKDQALKKIKAA